VIQHVLTGLDSGNPLGFLAALGLLRVLDDRAEKQGAQAPRLGFPDSSTPVLVTDLDFEAVVGAVLEDARVQGDNRALLLAYTAEGDLTVPGASGAIRDLKPRPRAAAAFLRSCVQRSRRESGLAAAWFSEVVTDDTKGNTKPTAFHFLAGNQTFLKIVDTVRNAICADDIREALIGPWRRRSALPTLRWDSTASRIYALRADDPSSADKANVPGADWLASIALEAFPVAARMGKLITASVKGGWSDAVFCWPIWIPPLSFRCVTSLLRVDAQAWTREQLNALGISAVRSSAIVRNKESRYGSFAPSEPVLPSP
jgi:hypothetical protein